MTKTLKTTLIIISIIFWFNSSGQTQDYSKNSLKYGIGFGFYDSRKITGGGLVYVVGYQRDIWKNQLQFNSNLTIGNFNSKYVQDIRKQWFTSTSLETILFFDLIKIRAFSIVIGAGGVINNTKGILGTGGYPPTTISTYVNNWRYGGYLGGGLRINPKSSQFALEFLPLNTHIGADYMEQYVKIGIELKL